MYRANLQDPAGLYVGARLSAIALSALVLACSSPRVVDFAPRRPGVCAERPELCEDGHAYVEVPDGPSPRSLAFVVDALSVPRVVEGRVAGFDLDGVDSAAGSEDPEASCGEAHADYESSLDPGVAGVDNRLSELVPTVEGLLDPMECPGGTTEGCLDHKLAEQIASGELLLAIEIGELESADVDDRVTVTISRASVRGGGAPELGPDGRLSPDQTFARGSEMSRTEGTVLRGRVDASVAALDLRVDLGDVGLPFYLRRVRVRFDLSELDPSELDPSEYRVARGVIAGATPVALAVGECDAAGASVAADMTLETEPCGDCNAVSAAFTFTAVPAVLTD